MLINKTEVKACDVCGTIIQDMPFWEKKEVVIVCQRCYHAEAKKSDPCTHTTCDWQDCVDCHII